MVDLSKEAQLGRSPGRNQWCSESGERLLRSKCPGPKCVGWRSQRKGQQGQRRVRKALGLGSEQYASQMTNEESWRTVLRLEVKSGKQVEPINRLYVEGRNQSDATKAIGDTRPFAYVAAPDGTMPLLVIRADEAHAVAHALLQPVPFTTPGHTP